MIKFISSNLSNRSNLRKSLMHFWEELLEGEVAGLRNKKISWKKRKQKNSERLQQKRHVDELRLFFCFVFCMFIGILMIFDVYICFRWCVVLCCFYYLWGWFFSLLRLQHPKTNTHLKTHSCEITRCLETSPHIACCLFNIFVFLGIPSLGEAIFKFIILLNQSRSCEVDHGGLGFTGLPLRWFHRKCCTPQF